MKTRNKVLDIYKGVLITLVIVRHALQYSVSDEGGYSLTSSGQYKCPDLCW